MALVAVSDTPTGPKVGGTPLLSVCHAQKDLSTLPQLGHSSRITGLPLLGVYIPCMFVHT